MDLIYSIQRFSNQWPLKALFNIASHSPIHHTFIHTFTPTAEATPQGDGQQVSSSRGGGGGGVSLRDPSTLYSTLGGAGIELATFRLPDNPLW